MPNNYQFLLKYHHLTGNAKALEAVTLTLDAIANGGIYDHLGGGFARYSTDAQWLVPHFEKMLYDNGQLVSLYAQAYQVTQNPLYKKRVEESLAFVNRELTSPEGAFFSSLDADSDGEEGKFYVWEKAEIDSILGDEKVAVVFNDFYEIKEKGNWEDGKNILHRRKPAADVAKKHDLSEKQLGELIARAKDKLFKARSKRVRPRLDDKALSGWNALMLKGYVDAYRALGDPAYLQAALKNGKFIVDKMMQDDYRLNRNYKDGNSIINAFLDDYGLTINAFVSLYQVTFDEQWLHRAKGMMEYVLQHFGDEESGLFFYTSDLDPALVARKMETTDNVIPGSNSVMARDLYLLGEYFYHDDWKKKAQHMMNKMATAVTDNKQPDFYSNWCQLYLDLVKPPYEVAIVGADAAVKRDELMRHYIPNALLLGGKDEGSLELLKDKLQDGITYIYVCQNKVCKLPVEEPEKALELMK
ncbi:MAG: thioredoxin domain-containing protein [Saprospiraceae bacterium]